jgi:membrane-associated protease RseP (regulator of RpoE activity)
MSSDYLTESSEEEPIQDGSTFGQVNKIVAEEFNTEEGFLDHGISTFYIKMTPESKNAFLKLMKRLDSIGFIPYLREENKKYVLRIFRKPPVKPSRISINLLLLIATVGTTLLTGYLISPPELVDPIIGAITFTISILAIIGTHELSHKFSANKHGIEATPPYFIPGPPPPLGVGTLGAVIQQKSLAPNRDALFDLGISGPIIGFAVATVVTIIGLLISFPSPSPMPGTMDLPSPLFFVLINSVLTGAGFLSSDPNMLFHPVAFAGWVGMFVTVINLIPAGQLDGGHTVRAILGRKTNIVLPIIAIITLLVLNPEWYWLMAILAFLFSRQEHPGPLDDVSPLTKSRKAAAILLIAVFVLCIAPALYILS